MTSLYRFFFCVFSKNKASLVVKNIDTKALENSLKKPPNASFRHLCNPQRIKYLQNMKAKGA